MLMKSELAILPQSRFCCLNLATHSSSWSMGPKRIMQAAVAAAVQGICLTEILSLLEERGPVRMSLPQEKRSSFCDAAAG
jgi:hypothetical protein